VKGVNLIDGQRTRSHLCMVDLAGSERLMLKVKRLKESQFINKSLSALGDVYFLGVYLLPLEIFRKTW
jgi:kinesin family protein C2/C3